VLILQVHYHSQPLSLIGEHTPHSAMGPLIKLLIVLAANIHPLADLANVADDHGLHALLIQRGNKSGGLLVFDILDLVLELLELSLLRPDQLFVSTGAFLFPVDLFVEMLEELVAILPLGAQQASIEDMGMLPPMRDSQLDLAQIDASYLAPNGSGFRFFLPIGSDGFILAARPADHHRLGTIPLPGEEERLVALPIGKSELALF
jgi:hypothetical protein